MGKLYECTEAIILLYGNNKDEAEKKEIGKGSFWILDGFYSDGHVQLTNYNSGFTVYINYMVFKDYFSFYKDL